MKKKKGKTIQYKDDEMIKGFRKGIKKSDLISSLSKEELERLARTRELSDMEQGSLSYKIAIECDHLRQQIKIDLREIDNIMVGIAELRQHIKRLQSQVDDNDITEQLGSGSVMTYDEIKSLIRKNQIAVQKEIDALPVGLGRIRAATERHDYGKNIIYTLEQWEEKVNEIQESLNKMGEKLFTH